MGIQWKRLDSEKDFALVEGVYKRSAETLIESRYLMIE
jgi:hypothetical protein